MAERKKGQSSDFVNFFSTDTDIVARVIRILVILATVAVAGAIWWFFWEEKKINPRIDVDMPSLEKTMKNAEVLKLIEELKDKGERFKVILDQRIIDEYKQSVLISIDISADINETKKANIIDNKEINGRYPLGKPKPKIVEGSSEDVLAQIKLPPPNISIQGMMKLGNRSYASIILDGAIHVVKDKDKIAVEVPVEVKVAGVTTMEKRKEFIIIRSITNDKLKILFDGEIVEYLIQYNKTGISTVLSNDVTSLTNRKNKEELLEVERREKVETPENQIIFNDRKITAPQIIENLEDDEVGDSTSEAESLLEGLQKRQKQVADGILGKEPIKEEEVKK